MTTEAVQQMLTSSVWRQDNQGISFISDFGQGEQQGFECEHVWFIDEHSSIDNLQSYDVSVLGESCSRKKRSGR